MPDIEESPNLPGARYRSFRELTVWTQAMDLVVEVYRLSDQLPSSERFGLGRELRKTAVSVPANIAEGFNRHSRAAYRSHVAIALGSQAELETHVELATRLNFIRAADACAVQSRIARVGQLLQGLWRALG